MVATACPPHGHGDAPWYVRPGRMKKRRPPEVSAQPATAGDSLRPQLGRLPEARRPGLWAARFVYLAASCYLAPIGRTVPITANTHPSVRACGFGHHANVIQFRSWDDARNRSGPEGSATGAVLERRQHRIRLADARLGPIA